MSLPGYRVKLISLGLNGASDKAEKALELALRAGKITPAMKDWALEYAKNDPAGFEVYVANAPKIVPVGDNLSGYQGKEDSGESLDCRRQKNGRPYGHIRGNLFRIQDRSRQENKGVIYVCFDR